MKTYHYGIALVALGGSAVVLLGTGLGWWRDAQTSAVQAHSADDAEPASRASEQRSTRRTSRLREGASAPGGTFAASEPQEVIADMDPGYLRSEIEQMAFELDQEHAIERLNSDDVTAAERAALSGKLERIARMRHALAERELETLMDEVDAYARVHAARVEHFLSADGEGLEQP